MIRNFFKSAIRNILRQKVYSFINIVDLAVGMACFILIMLWVQSEISYDKCFDNSDNIYLVHKSVPTGNGIRVNVQLAFPFATAIYNEVPEVEAITRVDLHPSLVRFGELHFDEQDLVAIDSSYFKIFKYEFIYGNAELVLRSPNEIVITESIAKKYFVDENPINKVLLLENNEQYVVSGVVKDPPKNTHLEYNMFIPIEPLYRNKEEYNDWFDHFLQCYIYAPSLVSVEILNDRLTEVLNKYTRDPETNTVRDVDIKLLPVSKLHLYNVEAKNQRIQYVYIFSLIALLILLVACINYMNIATSMSMRRSREIGLKKVVGAIRHQLTLQFLAEAFLQAFIAMLLAMMLVELARPFFNQLSGKEIFIPYASTWFIPVLLGLVLLTSLLAGAYPAFLMSSFKPVSAFKGNLVSGKGQAHFRKILVIFQFAISIALIISTLFIYLQLKYINTTDLGFEKDNIMYAYLNDDISKKYDSFRAELMKNPNIENVCRTSQLPNNISYGMRGIDWVGKEGDELSSFTFASVDFDFFETTGIKINEGRAFSREYGTDSSHYIMNEATIKMIAYDNPIGRQFSAEDEGGKIIGVVKDFHSKPLTQDIDPLFFIMNPEYYVYVMIRIRPENIEETTKYIETVWNNFTSLYVFESRFFNFRIDNEYRQESRNGRLALSFTIIVIIITCMGLFGLASHTAQRKTKEIGVRKVFGASVASLIVDFVKIFSSWVLIANIIAWPLAYYFVSNWLNNFAYGIKINLWVFLISAAVALFIAILTVAYQSFRAASMNPVESIRYE